MLLTSTRCVHRNAVVLRVQWQRTARSAAPRPSNVETLWRCFSAATSAPAVPAAASAQSVASPAPNVAAAENARAWDTIKAVLAVGKQEKAAKKNEKADESAKASLDTASVGRLLRLVRPELGTLGGAVATLGITTGISLLFPYVIGQVLDVAVVGSQLAQAAVAGAGAEGAAAAVDAATATTPAPSPKTFLGVPVDLGTMSTALLGLFAVQSGLIVVRSALLTIAGERMSAVVRKDLFKAILAQETAWFDKQRTGDLINRLSSDTSVLQKALTSNIANGLRSVFMTVGGVGMLVALSPTLAALSLVLIPPVAVSGVAYGRYVAGQQKMVQEALGHTMQVAEETVGAHRTVRQFAAEPREQGRFGAAVDESYRLARRIGIVAAYFDGGVHMAANIGLVAVLWYGGGLISSGAMTAGDLTAFLMYSLYTGFNVGNLSSTYTELKRAAGAASRVFDVIDRKPLMPNGHEGQEEGAGAKASPFLILPSVRGEVSFKDVCFSYPTRPHVPVLQGLNLTLQPGTTTALVGASGSGKSTVGLLLTRLYDPGYAAGSEAASEAGPALVQPSNGPGLVSVDGHDIRQLDPAWLRSNVVGVVAQEPVLFAASIADNIRYGRPGASDEEVQSAARLAHADGFIPAFPQGYATQVGERGVALSGGQKQRIAIARALLKDPRVLILDEATSALDSESEGLVNSALMAAAQGRTVLTIAHRLSTMRSADTVAVMAGGKVVETGPFDALAANPASAFRQLVDRQMLK